MSQEPNVRSPPVAALRCARDASGLWTYSAPARYARVPNYRRSLSLTPANAGRIRAAIQSLRNRTRHAAAAPTDGDQVVVFRHGFDAVVIRPREAREPRPASASVG